LSGGKITATFRGNNLNVLELAFVASAAHIHLPQANDLGRNH
jgi:hypothetical protein